MVLPCAHCSQPFDRKHAKRIYCSELCNSRAQNVRKKAADKNSNAYAKSRRTTESVCQWCGKSFKRGTSSPGKYCGNRCSSNGTKWTGKFTVLVPKACATCGLHMSYRPIRRKYCSDECAKKHGRKTYPCRPCNTCSKSYVPTRPNVVTCGDRHCQRWWQLNSPGARAAKVRGKARRRAREKGAVLEQFHNWEIFERDDWICYLCDKPVDKVLVAPEPTAPTLDHVVPLARGGGHTRANTRCAHFICNCRKRDLLLDQVV